MRIRKLARNNSGQALVETALILPVMLLVLLNAVNFGYFYLVALNLTAAARDGRTVFDDRLCDPCRHRLAASNWNVDLDGQLSGLSGPDRLAVSAGECENPGLFRWSRSCLARGLRKPHNARLARLPHRVPHWLALQPGPATRRPTRIQKRRHLF